MRWRQLLAGTFILALGLNAVAAPAVARAQVGTPAPESAAGVGAVSPVALRDALLATSLPADQLPVDVGPLDPVRWDDANDADLAGSLGGVIYAASDPFGADPALGITYIVYPDSTGPATTLATLAEIGQPVTITAPRIERQDVPAYFADLGDTVGVFLAIDNVLIGALAPATPELGDGERMAHALAVAGTEHLLAVAATLTEGATTLGGGTPVAAGDASTTGPDQPGFAAGVLTALAAARFPTDDLPVDTGRVIVVPDARQQRGDTIGWLTVRDETRDYPYPLAEYRIFATSDDARRAAELADAAPVPIRDGVSGWRVDTADSTTITAAIGPVMILAVTYGDDPEPRALQATIQAAIAAGHALSVKAGLDATPAAD